jgi:GT2 family glycosyltransferase
MRNHLPNDVSVRAILVDDGSTDGTAVAVHGEYPSVEIVEGDGNLFWNGGMRMAFAEAMKTDYDYFLWLNDDTLLYPDAVSRLLAASEQQGRAQAKEVIVVGSTQSEVNGVVTYGGVRRTSKWRTLKFALVVPREKAVQCYTMNGNCVLIPQAIARVVGNLEPAFTHAMGDMDYGLRAKKAGFSIWVMPGYAGTCSHNNPAGSWMDTGLPVWHRFRKLMQAKGLPAREWFLFTMRHGGWLGPFYWIWPYLKVIAIGLSHPK